MLATISVPRIAAEAMLFVACALLMAAPSYVEPSENTPDTLLIQTLLDIRDNRLDAALNEVNEVLHNYPNFRLANLIKGDLLLSHAQPLYEFGSAPQAPRGGVENLREEALVRLARYRLQRPSDRVPKYLLQLDSEQKYALIVDTSHSTLYVFENDNGRARYLADYYVSSGKNGADKMRSGDKKTPLGVYQIAGSLPRAKLAAFYGVAAFPLNYPNEWDRREGRNGHGIWLHGTPINTYSRPPRASDGCVVLTNQDLKNISSKIRIGVTPVIITESLEWASSDETEALREELLTSVESWRRDWESRNIERFLGHYATAFSSGHHDFAAWAQQKRAVNADKRWVKVGLNRLSIFLYPDQEGLAVVTFDQDYSSNNLSNRMEKRQYWVRQKGTWRIIYEGAA